jgi:RecA-family ATPase
MRASASVRHSVDAVNTLPSPQEWARLLGGKVMPNGRTVRYPRPGRKPDDRSLTLTVGAEFPGGYSVADPEELIPWQEQKDHCAQVAGLSAFRANQNSNRRGNGASHRPAGGSIVQEAVPAGAPPVGEGEVEAAASPPLFRVLDADEALRAKVPDLLWHVEGWIPGNNVFLLAGNGGEGKSILALQLAHVTRCGMPFFGRAIRAGAAVYYSAEETEDELAYRLQRISRSVLIGGAPDNPLKLISMADRTALLAIPDGGRTGEMNPTPLLEELEELVHDIEAALLVIDARADTFGGNELDRAQVRSFIALLRGIASRNQCAVVLLDHPSVSGMNDGRGYSGVTAWNNSVRGLAALTTPKGDKGDELDPCLRQLELKKLNNGARGAKILMRYDNGAFHQTKGGGGEGMSLQQKAKAMMVFLELAQKATDQGRHLSDKKNSPAYAPAALEHEAKGRDVTKAQLMWAMQESFAQNRLAMVEVRKDGKSFSRLVVAQTGEAKP